MGELKRYKQVGAVFAESLGDSIPEMERKGWTVNGNPLIINGLHGKVSKFDGSDDIINIRNLDYLTNFSVCVWIKRDRISSAGATDRLIGGALGGWVFYLETDDKINFGKNGAGPAISNSAINDLSWHYLSVVYNSGNVIFYIDGILDKTQSKTLTSLSSNGDYSIGGTGGGQFFKGQMSDVLIFDRALSAQEVNQIYTNQTFKYDDNLVSAWKLDDPNPRDLVGQNHGVGTSLDQTNVVEGPVRGSKAVNFDGSADYVSKSVADYRSNDLKGSIFALFNTSSFSNDQTLLCSADTSVSNKLVHCFVENSSSKLKLQVQNGGSINQIEVDETLFVDKWYFCGVASDGNNYFTYLNGDIKTFSITFGSDDGSWFNFVDGRDNLVIGANIRDSIGDRFTGKISKILVFNVDLTELQVKDLYNRTRKGLI